MKYQLLGIVVAVLLIGACATVPPSQNPSRVADLLTKINEADPGALVEQSHEPFLFTDELLARAADIEMVWSSIRDAGINFSQDGEPIPAQSGDYHRIANTFDLEVFFSADGYFPPDATWVPVASSAGAFDLLIGGSRERLPIIYGIVRVDR